MMKRRGCPAKLDGGRSAINAAHLVGEVLRGLLALVAALALIFALPWALVHFVGWPLPDHLPTFDEVESSLAGAMSAQFLLNALACLCWVAWLYFVIDVLRWATQVARDATWPATPPLGAGTGLAATLISTVVVSLLASRASALPLASPQTTAAQSAIPTVAAPLCPDAAQPQVQRRLNLAITSREQAPPGMVEVVEEVRAPEDGIYDSLWRIADRVLGDGDRWPELYELNRGVEQLDGRALETPGMVRPGWAIAAHVPAGPPASPEHAEPPPPRQEPSRTDSSSSTSSPTLSDIPPAAETDDKSGEGPGLYLPTGGMVSLALVGLAIGAAASARAWSRRRYRIGSGDRSDLERPAGPVVRSLQLAREELGIQVDLDDIEVVEPHRANPRARSTSSGCTPRIGVRNGREVALDIAATRGLGLVGPGAVAAARALLLHLLAQQHHDGVRIVLPMNDLQALLGGAEIASLPSAMTVVDSLDEALAEMESILLTRTRTADEGRARSATTLILVASPVLHLERRLQAVLDNGSTLGLAGVLLGSWQPGGTARVRTDGSVSATTLGTGGELVGTRLFTLPSASATELLDLLGRAEGRAAAPGVLDVPSPRAVELAADKRSAEPAAKQLPASAGEDRAARTPLALRVFGPVELVLDVNGEPRVLASVLTPKQREVLAFLALHPDGARRDALNEAIWPDAGPPRPYNSLHNALSLLRRALAGATDGAAAELVLNDDGRYRLNKALVTTDYDRLRHVLRSKGIGEDGLGRLRDVLELHHADFAEDITSSWVDPFRESIRRDVLDAQANLITRHRNSDPEVALELLERARNLDRFNEDVYREILRLQGRLGRFSAIRRTMRILVSALREIDQEPSDETVDLADSLQCSESMPQVAGEGP